MPTAPFNVAILRGRSTACACFNIATAITPSTAHYPWHCDNTSQDFRYLLHLAWSKCVAQVQVLIAFRSVALPSRSFATHNMPLRRTA